MGTTRSVVKKAESHEWLRCQHAIRKLMIQTGKDSLVYAKGALEHEDTEPERLKVFWDNAKKFFEEYEMPKAAKPKTVRTVVPEPPAAPVPAAAPVVPVEAPQVPAIAPEKT